MSKAKKYHPKTPIKKLLDREGEIIFSEEEVELLHKGEFYTLRDLFLSRSLMYHDANPRFDSSAKQAKSLLLKFNPNSNRLPYLFVDLYNDWRDEERGAEAKRKEEASRTVPRTVTAPVGRYSRMTRQFKKIVDEDIFDVIEYDGRKFDTNRGAMGFFTDEDEYGYNG
jgi:hypothetical protein